MNEKIRFDESLKVFVQIVADVLGDTVFEESRIVRDAYGRLTLLSRDSLERKTSKRLRENLLAKLGPYTSADTVVIGPSDFGADPLWKAPSVWRTVPLRSGSDVWVHVIDRRIVGQDWVASPLSERDPTPSRLVFASMKGGVGRSTALCVLAVHLAQEGRNVLVIDADLEAPGLGSLLLSPDDRPIYGLIDYLVENGLGGWGENEHDAFVGHSLLTDRIAGQGLVEVIPAIGRRTLENPVEMLAKLSRSMLEDSQENGTLKTVREQIREFVDLMSARRNYDAILIDARAGLSEIAGSIILGLGARVLFFGVNQPQTFEDYRFLLSHLAHVPAPSDPLHDWRRRINFVHSKADPQGDDISNFQDQLYELMANEFYEEDDGQDHAFVYSVDDKQAPHVPLVINFDFPYMQFDPVKRPGQLKRETYQAAFAEFLTGAAALLQLESL